MAGRKVSASFRWGRDPPKPAPTFHQIQGGNYSQFSNLVCRSHLRVFTVVLVLVLVLVLVRELVEYERRTAMQDAEGVMCTVSPACAADCMHVSTHLSFAV